MQPMQIPQHPLRVRVGAAAFRWRVWFGRNCQYEQKEEGERGTRRWHQEEVQRGISRGRYPDCYRNRTSTTSLTPTVGTRTQTNSARKPSSHVVQPFCPIFDRHYFLLFYDSQFWNALASPSQNVQVAFVVMLFAML
ncbi:uncharacterized protein V1513DRAFT_44902 [Lipomyces chichibuensis]|uniref:uncharacterized protein n=1 Tax=Lipomyces chichibuensis TaxID=1546026 RepID=UPI0033435E4C